jgi:hypothetical protein
MSFFLIPLIILGSLVVLFGLLVLLARIQNGRFLRPIIMWLSKIPWMKRQFEKVSKAAIERQNPDLASAMRKLERVGRNPDPQRAQAALSQLTATERRAYMDAIEQQGAMPEPANREQRRRQQRLTQPNRPSSGGGTQKRKKR